MPATPRRRKRHNRQIRNIEPYEMGPGIRRDERNTGEA